MKVNINDMREVNVESVFIEVIQKENNNSNKWVLFIPGAVNSAEEVAINLKKILILIIILSV